MRWKSQENQKTTQTENDCTTSQKRKSADKMKYFSKKIRNEYGEFDSNAEFERFLYLKHQEDIGVISDLQRQVKFEIIPKLVKKVEVVLKTKTKEVEKIEEKAAHYTADFCYIDYNGQYIIEELNSRAFLYIPSR